MEKCRQQRDVLDRAARARKSLEAKRFNEKQVPAVLAFRYCRRGCSSHALDASVHAEARSCS